MRKPTRHQMTETWRALRVAVHRAVDAALGGDDPTFVEYELDVGDTETTLRSMLVALSRELAHASGSRIAVVSRVYVRVEARAWTTDVKELAE